VGVAGSAVVVDAAGMVALVPIAVTPDESLGTKSCNLRAASRSSLFEGKDIGEVEKMQRKR